MKKLFYALLATVALTFALSACTGNENKPTPVDTLMDKMVELVDFSRSIQDKVEMQTTENIKVMMDKMTELKEFAKENAEYVLTDLDRAKLKAFMKESGDKLGINPTEKDLEETDNFKTLQDIIDSMGL